MPDLAPKLLFLCRTLSELKEAVLDSSVEEMEQDGDFVAQSPELHLLDC